MPLVNAWVIGCRPPLAEEAEILLRTVSEGSKRKQIRDAVILALAWGVGLRKSEIGKVERSDYDPETGNPKVRKKRTSRNVPLAKKQGLALNEWLNLRGDEKGPLFRPILKNGSIKVPHLSPGERSIISPRRRASSSLRDLRHGYLGNLLASGMEVGAIQHLVGCCSIRTILRYPCRLFPSVPAY